MTLKRTETATSWRQFRSTSAQEIKAIIMESDEHSISSVAKELNIDRTTLQQNFNEKNNIPDGRIICLCDIIKIKPGRFFSKPLRKHHAEWVLEQSYEQVSDFAMTLDLQNSVKKRLLMSIKFFFKGVQKVTDDLISKSPADNALKLVRGISAEYDSFDDPAPEDKRLILESALSKLDMTQEEMCDALDYIKCVYQEENK